MGLRDVYVLLYFTLWCAYQCDKILGVACDNASNNGTMLKELEYQIPTFNGRDAQSWCLCHILSLVMKVHTFVRNYG